MKTINIPLKLQQKGSLDCGPVCAQMVLEYFGIKKELSYLQEKLHYDNVGTSAYDNGTLLLDEGLKVTAYTAQPKLFPPDVIETITSKQALFDVIRNKRDQLTSSQGKDNLRTFEKFLTRGGEIKLQIPNFDHIKNAIDRGEPVIALIIGQALGSKEGGFHFVVVSGYNDADNTVHVINPSEYSSQKSWFPVERFLYAVHSSTAVDFDNGTFLVVSK